MSGPTVSAADPVVVLDGQTLAATAAGAVPGPVVVGELGYTWGVGGLFDQPAAGTASVTLLCSRAWLLGRALIGRPLQVFAANPGTVTGSSTALVFTGRVTDAAARLAAVESAGSTERPILLVLTAASDLTSLANTVLSGAAWPAESFAARTARLKAAVTASGAAVNVTTRATFDTRAAAARKIDGVDLLTLLREHYNSCNGDRMLWTLFGMNGGPITPKAGIGYATRRTWAVSTPGLLIPDSLGRITATTPDTSSTDGTIWSGGVGTWIDAAALEWTDTPVLGAGSGITQVAVSWLDSTGAAQTVTTAVPGADPAVSGVQSLSVPTVLSTAADAAACGSALAAVAAGEARAWQPGKLRWTGDDIPVDAAWALLGGQPSNGLLFLLGSQLDELGVPPVVGVLGGTVRYVAGRWSVEFTPTPFYSTTGPTPRVQTQHAVAAGRTDTLAALHPRLRTSDFAFIGQGLAQPTVYPEV